MKAPSLRVLREIWASQYSSVQSFQFDEKLARVHTGSCGRVNGDNASVSGAPQLIFHFHRFNAEQRSAIANGFADSDSDVQDSPGQGGGNIQSGRGIGLTTYAGSSLELAFTFQFQGNAIDENVSGFVCRFDRNVQDSASDTNNRESTVRGPGQDLWVQWRVLWRRVHSDPFVGALVAAGHGVHGSVEL